MVAEEIPVGEQLRSLVFELHSVLKQSAAADPAVVADLMFRASALKAQLRCEPSNPLIRYLSSVQRLIGRAYHASPSSALPAVTPTAGRHAA